MAALAAADGAEVVATGHIPDTLENTVATLQRALVPHPGSPRCDVLITTGGVSVGDADYLKPAWTAVGGTLDLWQIAMNPENPSPGAGTRTSHWFGLPGNPVSAFVTWTQLVRPALRRLLGERSELPASRVPRRIDRQPQRSSAFRPRGDSAGRPGPGFGNPRLPSAQFPGHRQRPSRCPAANDLARRPPRSGRVPRLTRSAPQNPRVGKRVSCRWKSSIGRSAGDSATGAASAPPPPPVRHPD